jgi:hypothetical protein
LKRFSLSCLVILLVAGAAGRSEARSRNFRSRSVEEGVRPYFGFGIGAGANAGGVYGEEAGIGAPNLVLSFKLGIRLSDKFIIADELFVSGPLLIYAITNDLVFKYYPVRDNGFYLLGGLGYSYLVSLISVDRGANTQHGFDVRYGLGYDKSFGGVFHLGVELVSSTTFLEDGYLTNTFLLMTLAWH